MDPVPDAPPLSLDWTATAVALVLAALAAANLLPVVPW